MKSRLLFSVFILGFALAAFAQDPFQSGTKNVKQSNNQHSIYNTVIDSALQKTIQWQREIRTALVKFIKEIKEEGFGRAFAILLGFSFLYGLVHALGPGHGKVITVSYFLSGKRKISSGVMFGYTLMFIHTMTGAAITLIIWFFLERAKLSILNESVLVTQKISFSLILLIGIYLLYHNFHDYQHLKQESPAAKLNKANNRNLFVTAGAIGIVPCPGTAALIVFCLSQQLLGTGLIAILFVALGMGFTLSLFAIATILAQKQMLGLLVNYPKTYRYAYLTLSQGSALLIIVIAISMLL